MEQRVTHRAIRELGLLPIHMLDELDAALNRYIVEYLAQIYLLFQRVHERDDVEVEFHKRQWLTRGLFVFEVHLY